MAAILSIRKQSKPIGIGYQFSVTGYIEIDRQWNIVRWNAEASRLLKINHENFSGKNLWQIIGHIMPVEYYAFQALAFVSNGMWHVSDYIPQLDAWFTANIFQKEDRLAVAFYPAASQNCSDNYSDLSDQHPANFHTNWELDVDEEMFSCFGQEHAQLLGYPLSDTLLPQFFWESLIHPEDVAEVVIALQALRCKPRQIEWNIKFRIQHADGHYISVEDNGFLIQRNGLPTTIVGTTAPVVGGLKPAMESNAKKRAEVSLAKAIATARQAERTEIGKELHDNINQVLGATKLYLEMARKDRDNWEPYLQKATDFLTQAIGEIRSVSKSLQPVQLLENGLSASVLCMIDNLRPVNKLDIRFTHRGVDPNLLPGNFQINIFRIIQEQLTNVLKHSNASEVCIDIEVSQSQAQLKVADNGRGCDMNSKGDGIGLSNISNRMMQLKGTLMLESSPGHGFNLIACFPLNK